MVAQETLIPKTYTVEGAERRGLLHLPPQAGREPPPVIFAFHGHGGSAPGFARSFAIHRHAPEAIVVYLQGLPTVGRLTDPEGKRSGWQNGPGENGDRDLKLVDAVLAGLSATTPMDPRRVFATGHSHGGAFTFQLWLSRGERFAAFAPMAALIGETNLWPLLKPKPVLHVAGEQDGLVKFAWQGAMVDFVRGLNGATGPGTLLPDGLTRRFESTLGTPVLTLFHGGGHGGGHEVPAGAAPSIAGFFRSIRP